MNQLMIETNVAGSPPVFPCPWASAWGEDRYGLWMALDYQGVRYVFRWIMPGSFWMGSPDDEKGRHDDEDQHRVTLSKGFWLGKTTVTQEFWQAVTGNNPSYFKGENLPVEMISWDDTQNFINQINRFHPALLVRLPWEAEWEYACRADTETAFNFGNTVNLGKVNYRGIWERKINEWVDEAKKASIAVKSYPSNDWGLYEMHGNVWEWGAEHWQDRLDAEAVVDPWERQAEIGAGTWRVVRGGSWSDFGRDVRSAIRLRNEPHLRFNLLGFRLALGY